MRRKQLLGLLVLSPVALTIYLLFLIDNSPTISWSSDQPSQRIQSKACKECKDVTDMNRSYGHHAHHAHAHHTYDCQVKEILQRMSTYKDTRRFQACQRVFYNRVPKCASRTILATFSILAGNGNFNLVQQTKAKNNFLSKEEELRNFTENFASHEDPFLFSRHIHYVDFNKYNMIAPVYINVIRDPLERVQSHYYYHLYGSVSGPNTNPNAFKNNKTLTLDECVANYEKPRNNDCTFILNVVLPFFCGHARIWRGKYATEDMLARAKQVVRDYYLVVGMVEDLPAFMEVLQYFMPHFFNNATSIFEEIEGPSRNKFKTVKKQDLNPISKKKLKRILSLEYEFYAFIKQRFYNQLRRVRLMKNQQMLTEIFHENTTGNHRDEVS